MVELAVDEDELGIWRVSAVHGCMIVDDREVGMTSRATTPRNSLNKLRARGFYQRAALSLLRARVPRHALSGMFVQLSPILVSGCQL